MLIIYNPTAEDIEVESIGVTLLAEDFIDIGYVPFSVTAKALDLMGMVENGTVQVLKAEPMDANTPVEAWSVADATDILHYGVNSYQMNLHKAVTVGVADGRYYSILLDVNQVSQAVVEADRIHLNPVPFMGYKFNRIGIEVTTSQANGAIRLGIYSNNNGTPGELLLDAGTVTTDTIGKKEIVIDFTTPMDWCWLAALPSANTICKTINQSGFPATSVGMSDGIWLDSSPHTYGALPQSFPVDFNDGWTNPPYLWLRKV